MPGLAFDLPAGFAFVRVLGYGANGIVVLARQLALDRLVAVKTIRVITASADVERLRREARVLAALRHPNILPVFQLHEGPASLSLVMKHQPRGDLGAAAATLTGSEVVDALRDVAAALAAAHQQGIVHRDVKPANVLLDENGRAVLADFGLARLPRDPHAFRTVGSVVTGTPLYLAPEQILQPQLEAPSIDHYAFGVLAYQLVTGRWPYPPPTWHSVNESHLHASPVPAHEVLPGLPASVTAALSRLLDKNPRRRGRPEQLLGALDGLARDRWDALIPGRAAVLDAAAPATELGTEQGPPALAAGTADLGLERPPLAAGRSEPATTLQVADGPPSWVVPPVYRPARGRLLGFRLAIAVLGIILGVLGYLAWLHR